MYITFKTFRTTLTSDEKVSKKNGYPNFLSVQSIYSAVFNFKVAPKLLVLFIPGFMERTLVETLLEIRNCMIRLTPISRRRAYLKTLRGQFKYYFHNCCFSLSNSCFLRVNLLNLCFSRVLEIFTIRNLSELR